MSCKIVYGVYVASNKAMYPFLSAQERSDDMDRRKQDIENANRRLAESKRRQDNGTNSRR